MHTCVFTGTHMLEFGQYTHALYITYEAMCIFAVGYYKYKITVLYSNE